MKRPFGVSVVALLELLTAIGLGLAFYLNSERDIAFGLSDEFWLTVPFRIVGSILIGIGLWLMYRAAWFAMMILTGFFMALDLYSYITNQANFLMMALNIVIVFYLNQYEVRQAFHLEQPRQLKTLIKKSNADE